MTEEERIAIIAEAYERASEVLGCDPGYYGEEGDEEVGIQLKKMGYQVEDFIAKK